MSRETRAWLRRLIGAVAKLVLFAASGAYLAYVIGINVFLSTALFDRAVNGSPRTLDIHYGRGWSVWPGRVHAKDLSIRSRDGSVEWILHIHEVQFDVSLVALPRQRFEVSHVRGTGGSFRLRSRLDPQDVTPERLAGLPPIEGFPAVPVRPYRQCSANEWSDAHYNLWTIQLEDVHAEAVAQLWINRYRLDGETRASGRFYLEPVRAVEVGPLHAEIRASQLSVGGATWAEGLDGTADFTLPRFDPRVHGGKKLLQELSLAVDIRGVVPDVGRLPLPLPGSVRVRGALELRRLGMRFEGGRPRGGSHLEIVAPHVVAEQSDHRVSSSLAVTADIVGRDEGLAFRVVAGGARLERTSDAGGAARETAGETLLLAPRVDVAGDSGGPGLDRRLDGLHVTAGSPDIELPDARVLASYIPPSAHVTLAGGRARGEAWAEAWPDEGRVAGRAGIKAEDLDVTAGDVRARGGVEARASLASFDWRTGRLDRPEASVTARSRVEIGQPQAPPPGQKFAADVHAVVLARGFDPREQTIDVSGSGVAMRNIVVAGEPATSSSGDAALSEATLRLDTPELQGVASAEVTDATTLLAGAGARDHVPRLFRRLLDLPRLLASARLSVNARRVELSDVEARGGVLVVHGLIAARGGDHLGAFVVQGGPISVGVRLDPDGTHVRLFGLSGWLQGQEETVEDRFGAP